MKRLTRENRKAQNDKQSKPLKERMVLRIGKCLINSFVSNNCTLNLRKFMNKSLMDNALLSLRGHSPGYTFVTFSKGTCPIREHVDVTRKLCCADAYGLVSLRSALIRFCFCNFIPRPTRQMKLESSAHPLNLRLTHLRDQKHSIDE